MRILLTSHYGLPHLGGIETVVDALARELSRRGHEVTHVASHARRPDEAAAEPTAGAPAGEPAARPPYRVLRVPALNVLEERLDVPYPLFSPRLVPVLRREARRADVVHAHGFLYMPTPIALAFGRDAARVLTEHVGAVGWSAAQLRAAERIAVATVGRASARLAQGLVALNDKVEAELRELAPSRPVERILNGVDTDAYRPPEPGERERLRASLGWGDRPRALFVGRLVEKKGAALAIAAARRAEVELTLAGPGRPPAPLPEGVEHLGTQAPARIRELMRAADAFLLPSRGEGFPLTAQEALASGLGVVLCDDPAYRPYVDGAGDAVRLAAPDADSLARALRELTRDPAARRALSKVAAAHARRRFSWQRAADEHEALYAQLRDERG